MIHLEEVSPDNWRLDLRASVKSRKRRNGLEKIHILFANKLTPERTLAA